MLPSPGTALSSLWKAGCQLSTHHPAEALCRNPLGTETRVAAPRRAVHSSAAQPPTVPPWVGTGRDGYRSVENVQGTAYLVLLSPDDLCRCFDLAHVLMERVPGLFIHDF